MIHCSRSARVVSKITLAGLAVAGALMLVHCSSKPPVSLVTPLPSPIKQPGLPRSNEPVRGVWLTTVSRLDWPPVESVTLSDPQMRIRQQQNALTAKLDKLKSLGINTVFFQVKPDGTALWPSKILPWSDMLTGKIGQDPGYDPLKFMLDEAHKRGMRVHAWFNPYRVSVNTRPRTVSELNATLSQTPPASSCCIATGSELPATALSSTPVFPKSATGSPASLPKWWSTTRWTASSLMTTSIPKRRALP